MDSACRRYSRACPASRECRYTSRARLIRERESCASFRTRSFSSSMTRVMSCVPHNPRIFQSSTSRGFRSACWRTFWTSAKRPCRSRSVSSRSATSVAEGLAASPCRQVSSSRLESPDFSYNSASSRTGADHVGSALMQCSNRLTISCSLESQSLPESHNEAWRKRHQSPACPSPSGAVRRSVSGRPEGPPGSHEYPGAAIGPGCPERPARPVPANAGSPTPGRPPGVPPWPA